MKEFELEPGEYVVVEMRKHWFLFLLELLPYAILTLLPIVFIKIFAFGSQSEIHATLIANQSLVNGTLSLWGLIIWTASWGAFTRYFLNAWIVTNKRIVDIKQSGYFNREVSSLFLSRVQDITTNVIGVLPSLLGLGNITVQSAGAVDEFHMYGISNPEKIRDLILRYVDNGAESSGV